MTGRAALTLLAVGKLREKHWTEAQAEYAKRLAAYTTRLEIIEVADSPTPDDASPAGEEAIRATEGERLLAKIPPRAYVVALDRTGRALDSPGFAAHLERVTGEGVASSFVFVIGGSLGLSQAVLTRADYTLSFGAFTFPHQLMRVVLLEQIYRAMKITRNEPYHK